MERVDPLMTQFSAVRVGAPARIHLGFNDLNGGMGRRFGSVGLTLEQMGTQVFVQPGAKLKVIATTQAQRKRAEGYALRVAQRLQVSDAVEIRIVTNHPSHSGLGSGTQLALAVGTALARLHSVECPASDIARLLGRGNRSGIGIGAFQTGGFLVDGGRAAEGGTPPVIARHEFPASWRVLLIFDNGITGLHGDGEQTAFSKLQPFTPEQAGELCRMLFMRTLPALVERDFDAFASGVGHLQRVVGDYFAPAQSGRYASPRVAEVCQWLSNRHGLKGVGQSSWGPTGFAFLDDPDKTDRVLGELKDRYADLSMLDFEVAEGRNSGSVVNTYSDALSGRQASKY